MFCFKFELTITLLSIISCSFALLEDEPKCTSRFDYEYKVVQKLIELENKAKEQQEMIDKLTEQSSDEPKCTSRFDYEYKVVQKLIELENKAKEQQEMIDKLTEQSSATKNSQQEVAFSAYLIPDMTGVPDHRIIIFNEVQTNIGDAYNGKTGIFVCNIPGVYVFYWATTNKDHTWMNSEFVINGQLKTQAFSDAGNHADYAVTSNSVIAELKFGDQVWIRSGTWHNGNLAGSRRTSFSGWLLYSR